MLALKYIVVTGNERQEKLRLTNSLFRSITNDKAKKPISKSLGGLQGIVFIIKIFIKEEALGQVSIEVRVYVVPGKISKCPCLNWPVIPGFYSKVQLQSVGRKVISLSWLLRDCIFAFYGECKNHVGYGKDQFMSFTSLNGAYFFIKMLFQKRFKNYGNNNSLCLR